MTAEEMAQKCADAIDNGIGLRLVLPGEPPETEMVRLDRIGKGPCPMGEVLCWSEWVGGTVAIFDPVDVLAWMVACGMAVVAVEEKES